MQHRAPRARRRLVVEPADDLARRWRTLDDRLTTTSEPIVAILEADPFDDLVIVANVNGNRAHLTTVLEFVGLLGSPEHRGSTTAWCGASLGDRGDVYALRPRQGIPACTSCIDGMTNGRPGTDRDVLVAALVLVGPVESEAP